MKIMMRKNQMELQHQSRRRRMKMELSSRSNSKGQRELHQSQRSSRLENGTQMLNWLITRKSKSQLRMITSSIGVLGGTIEMP